MPTAVQKRVLTPGKYRDPAYVTESANKPEPSKAPPKPKSVPTKPKPAPRKRSSVKPKVEAPPPPPPDPEKSDTSPPDLLRPEFARFFESLVKEVLALRHMVTRSDYALIKSACFAAQNEEDARTFAADAQKKRQPKDFMSFTKLAQSEARAKSQALSALLLIGDNRRGGKASRAAMAAQSSDVTTDDGDWNDV